jgi:hypothetical protein
MKISKTITILTIGSLMVSTSVFAQNEGRPGMRQEFREERREDIKEIRGEMMDEKKDFRADMKERKQYMMGSTTGMATPTPWKNLKGDMKDIKKDFMEDRREDRQAFKPLNATATAAIATKLGITAEALKAQLASGTKLKELIKDRISPEEMKNILPPRVATFTRAVQENGFFNNVRAKIFGQRREVIEQKMNEFGEVEENVSPDTTNRPFWKRFFGF